MKLMMALNITLLLFLMMQCVVHDGEVSNIIPGSKSGTCNTYCLIKQYYKHATAGDFKRTIAVIYGEQLYLFSFTYPGTLYCFCV